MPNKHFFVFLSFLAACAPRPPEAAIQPSPDAGPPDAAPAAVSPDDPALKDLKAIVPRQACNRVTGCPGLVALARHGHAVLAPARLALLTPGKPEGYWVLALTELLGTLGEPDATDILVPLLSDKRWETRIAAARALGLLGPKTTLSGQAAVAAALTSSRAGPSADTTLQAALEFASWRIAGSSATEPPSSTHRQNLLALLPRDAEAVATTPHPQLDILARLVGDARLPEGLPTVRYALLSGNRFVNVTALDVAGLLQDNGAIPYALALLDDANPTVRKESLRALQRITGAQLDTADAWRAWAETHGVKPAAHSGKGGSSSPSGTDQGPDGP